LLDLVGWRISKEDALSSAVVGLVEVGEQNFEIGVSSDVDAKDFADDTTIEALDHAVGLRPIRLYLAARDCEIGTGPFEIVGGKARGTVGQHMGDLEGQRLACLGQETNGVGGVLGVVHRQMDEARAAIDGDIQVTLAHLSVGGAQRGQVFDADVDEAKIIVPEASLTLWRVATSVVPIAG
jgi:hypothetical protein